MMTYKDLIEIYPSLDLFIELFKGLAPTIVAVLAIIINNAASVRREKKAEKRNKVKRINESKIIILNEMLNKYIELSQMFWKSGKQLLAYLSDAEENKRQQDYSEFEQNLYQFQFKSQEIYDYFASMMKQYDFGIGCDSSIDDANQFANELISICGKYSEAYEIIDETKRNNVLDNAMYEIKESTADVKAWTNVIMVNIAKKIKELYEE